MRKITAIILCSFLFLPLVGCDKDNQPLSTTSDNIQYLMEFTEADEHTHDPASDPQTAADPISGFCGNTVTRIIKNGVEKAFGSDDSVELTAMLINLDYSKPMCKCAAEFSVYVETEAEPYEVNLSQNFARFGGKHAELTAEQVETIRTILDNHFLKEETREIIIEKPQDIPVSYPNPTP